MRAAEARQLQLTKPPKALGRLETISIQLAGIQGKEQPVIEHKAIAVMAADHGVVAEGVSAFPAEVTPAMVFNMVAGGAGINVIGRHVGARVIVTDVGVNADLSAAERPPGQDPHGHRQHGAGPGDDPRRGRARHRDRHPRGRGGAGEGPRHHRHRRGRHRQHHRRVGRDRRPHRRAARHGSPAAAPASPGTRCRARSPSSRRRSSPTRPTRPTPSTCWPRSAASTSPP